MEVVSPELKALSSGIEMLNAKFPWLTGKKHNAAQPDLHRFAGDVQKLGEHTYIQKSSEGNISNHIKSIQISSGADTMQMQCLDLC